MPVSSFTSLITHSNGVSPCSILPPTPFQSPLVELKANHGFEAQIVAISDWNKGSLYHPEGLDINLLLETVQETGSLEAYPTSQGLKRDWDSIKTIKESNADTIVEVSM